MSYTTFHNCNKLIVKFVYIQTISYLNFYQKRKFYRLELYLVDLSGQKYCPVISVIQNRDAIIKRIVKLMYY